MTLLLRLRQRLAEGIRHRVTLLGAMILAMLLASGMLAFTTSQNPFFLLFSLLLAALILSSFLNRLNLAGLEAELQMDPHPVAGSPVRLQIQLKNAKSLLNSFALEIRPQGASPLRLPVLGPNQTITLSFDKVFPRRGTQPPLQVDLETRFPFGFSVRRARLRLDIPHVVYPSLDEKPGYEERLAEILARRLAAAPEEEQEFSHLREYTAGDPTRNIAWSASARLTAGAPPLVSATVPAGEGGIHLWLDRRCPYLDFENLVQFTAWLCWQLQYKNQEFVLAAEGEDRPREEFRVRSAADTYTVLKYLAVVSPASKAPLPHDPHYYLLSLRAGGLPASGGGPEHARQSIA